MADDQSIATTVSTAQTVQHTNCVAFPNMPQQQLQLHPPLSETMPPTTTETTTAAEDLYYPSIRDLVDELSGKKLFQVMLTNRAMLTETVRDLVQGAKEDFLLTDDAIIHQVHEAYQNHSGGKHVVVVDAGGESRSPLLDLEPLDAAEPCESTWLGRATAPMRLEPKRADDPVDRVRAAVDDGSELLESAVGVSMATAANNNNNSSSSSRSTDTATDTVPAGSGDGCESR